MYSSIVNSTGIILLHIILQYSVGKQGEGERGEAKAKGSQGRLSHKRGGEELKGKARVRTEERGEDPSFSTFSFIFVINLFKTILIIGLN